MEGLLIKIETERVNSPSGATIKVARFDDDQSSRFDGDPNELFHGEVTTDIYSARFLRYPGKPDVTLFVKTDDNDPFDGLVKITEADRQRIRQEGHDDGVNCGLKTAMFHYRQLSWWERLFKRW